MARKKELIKLVRLFVITTLLVGAILDWQEGIFFPHENTPRDLPSDSNNGYHDGYYYEYI